MRVVAHDKPSRGESRSDDEIEHYREHLARIGATVPDEGYVEVDTELKMLSELLLAPVAEFIPQGSPICVLAHAELHIIPFSALPLPSGEPLGLAHELTYAPSLTVLKLLLDREAAFASLSESATKLVVGNPELGLKLPPVPCSGSEAEIVAACIGAQPEELLLGVSAKLDTVRGTRGGLSSLSLFSCLYLLTCVYGRREGCRRISFG